MENNLIFIGEIETPFENLEDCPNNVGQHNTTCKIKIYNEFKDGLFGLETVEKITIMYWLGHSERTVNISRSSHSNNLLGTFALRTPVRPNPIGLANLKVLAVEENTIIVSGLDCLNGTKLIDIKPFVE